jgi:hypothetical protein
MTRTGSEMDSDKSGATTADDEDAADGNEEDDVALDDDDDDEDKLGGKIALLVCLAVVETTAEAFAANESAWSIGITSVSTSSSSSRDSGSTIGESNRCSCCLS